uniref:Uncharacterized protein n=1 Tax=Panagrolaimus davidi TaxID=227884 RepID=A0A914Q971_9BILA
MLNHKCIPGKDYIAYIDGFGESLFLLFYFICKFLFNSIFTKAGYEIISYKTLIYDEKDGVNALYEKILQSSNSSKIVATTPLSTGLPIFKGLKEKVLKLPNFIASELGGTKSAPKFACEIYKWLIDNSYVKYYIIPASTRYYFLQTFSGGKFNNGKIVFGNDTILPHQDTFNLPRWNLGFHITYVDETEGDRTILQKLELGSECHYHKITVLVDINNFPTVQCESLLSEHILNLPQKLTQIISEKYPVIIFRDSISLICIFNPQKNQYEFLDTWNDIFGRDLFISFDEKKPKYFEKAAEVFKLKPTFVVYDLLRILSIRPNELLANKGASHWGFTVTKDINNPILLMLLKQHIKAITKKTGTKPKQLACFYFDLNGDKNLVYDSIGEASKLLKIDGTKQIRELL